MHPVDYDALTIDDLRKELSRIRWIMLRQSYVMLSEVSTAQKEELTKLYQELARLPEYERITD